MHLAAMIALRDCGDAGRRLAERLSAKALAWHSLLKIGRTHLQDATPMTLGQEFSGYAQQTSKAVARLERCLDVLAEVAIGGTAVGTGLNCHPRFPSLVCEFVNAQTGLSCRPAGNHFEAQAAKDAVVETAGALTTVAVSLSKIANDIRLLGSGPRCGFGELVLPALQPGSSIMPGKVNPVICEAVIQVCAQVVGNGTTVALAGFGGVGSILELNVAMPVMAKNLLESIELLGNAMRHLADKVVDGLGADAARCAGTVENSLAMCTRLATVIGYDRAAALAKQAYEQGKTIREVARASGAFAPDELDRLLDPSTMI
jgi:fumarate hydratase class II